MEKTIIISSAKLVTTKGKDATGKHLKVSYTENLPDGKKATHDGVVYTADPHEDLKKAFARLGFFIGDMTDQFNSDGEIDENGIEARGFSISGEGEKQAVILKGGRNLSSGKFIALNTPKQKLDDESDSAYDDLDKLNKVLSTCLDEVKAYILQSKHAPDAQGSLFEEEKELAENEA